jgi:hypothetical protein
MNMDIAEHCDSFKADQPTQSGTSQTPTGNSVDIVRKIGRLPINPTAKLVAITMRTTRISDTKTLAEITGLSMRVIQKSKNEYATAADEFGEPSESDEPGFANPANATNPGSLSRAACARAPAQMEPPSGVSISQKVVASGAGEIPGLNENTGYFVEMLAGWLAGEISVPDHETAHRLLAGYVKAYSADAVKAGMIELETEIVQGRRPRDVGKAFSGFVRKAHERATAPSTVVAVPDWQQAKAEKNATARRLREHLTAMEAQ